MRLLLPIIAAALACGCASTGYRDPNARADANPLCTSRADRPGEPVSADCRREGELRLDIERKPSQPLDFSGRSRDD